MKSKNSKKKGTKAVEETTPLQSGNKSGPASATNENAASLPAGEVLPSTQSAMTPNESTQEKKQMTLNLKGLDKSGRNAVYTGAAISLRFPIGAFPDKNAPPATLTFEGLAGPREPKKPRAQMTKEEQKAARAAQPKLTLAEKVAKQEERLAAQKAKLAKQSEAEAAKAAAAAQPAQPAL